jgi:hypothetical protein
MRSETIEIGTTGVKEALKRHTLQSAIAEFVWNGFDAEASFVDIQYVSNEIGYISSLKITDDGSGINSINRFKPFLHTNKIDIPNTVQSGPSAIHGKNGIGRLSFFKVANKAVWQTTYEKSPAEYRQYEITINADIINKFTATKEEDSSGRSGTSVEFFGLLDITISNIAEMQEFLIQEFAWFLELKSPFARTIKINGKNLKYKHWIGDREDLSFDIKEKTFDVRYIRWKENLHNEYSRYYFIGSDSRERAKKTTTLNNKGDAFYHSVYVQSEHFDSLEEGITLPDEGTDANQLSLNYQSFEKEETFKELLKKLDEFLRKKRSPFLRKQAFSFIQKLEVDGSLPSFGPEVWERHRRQELVEVVREVYEADPRIFNGLNNQQKQTILQLFALVMDSSERDNLLDVLAKVVNLETAERADLAKILHSTQLSNVISTIKMIEDRFTAVDELKKMVFNPEFGANERDHLQTHIERHYWLFGEQYHLVTAAEPDFEQALRKYIYVLRGEDKPIEIDHPDKNKEMDIFCVRCLPLNNEINNVVIELKHPDVILGDKELGQVKKYMSVILNQSEFNAQNMSWEFYLVGNKYNSYIEGEMENSKANGIKYLVHRQGNYKIYVLKWSEVTTNFNLRHNFLLEKLKLERVKLATTEESADGILANAHTNSARSGEVIAPLLFDTSQQ